MQTYKKETGLTLALCSQMKTSGWEKADAIKTTKSTEQKGRCLSIGELYYHSIGNLYCYQELSYNYLLVPS